MEQDLLRVELRRYLAGIPFSHRREMSEDEVRQIRRQVRPYLACSLVFGVLAAVFVTLSRTEMGGFGYFMALVFGIVPVCCLGWAAPFLRALRQRVLDVYIGPMNALTSFDVAQSYYLKQRDMAANVGRYVELLAIGGGDRIWKLEGVGNDETVAGVRSVYVALVPDHDERGRRPLTPEERKELRVRSRDFMQIGPVLLATLATALTVAIFYGVAREVGYGNLAVAFLVFLVGLYYATADFRKRWAFGNLLLKEERAGIVENGILPSGLPWVVSGQPARWRVGRAKGDRSGVTLQLARSLEDWAAGASEQMAPAPASPLPNQRSPVVEEPKPDGEATFKVRT